MKKLMKVELEAATVASGKVKLLVNSADLMSNKDHDEMKAFKTWLTDKERAGSIVRMLRNVCI